MNEIPERIFKEIIVLTSDIGDGWKEDKQATKNTAEPNEKISSDFMRPVDEIRVVADEFYERLWFIRNYKIVKDDRGYSYFVPKYEEDKELFAYIMRKFGGVGNLLPQGKVDFGILKGRLDALRWVLGAEWDPFRF